MDQLIVNYFCCFTKMVPARNTTTRSISARIIWFPLALIDKLVQYWIWLNLFFIRGNAINRTLFLILTTINVLTKPLLYFKKVERNRMERRVVQRKQSCQNCCICVIVVVNFLCISFLIFYCTLFLSSQKSINFLNKKKYLFESLL